MLEAVADALWIRFPPALGSWKEGPASFFLSFLLFFPALKEGSILVFPKRERQRANEGASQYLPVLQAPHIKAPVESESRQ